MFEVVKVPVSHFLPFILFLLGLLYVCTVCSSFPLAPYPPVIRAASHALSRVSHHLVILGCPRVTHAVYLIPRSWFGYLLEQRRLTIHPLSWVCVLPCDQERPGRFAGLGDMTLSVR